MQLCSSFHLTVNLCPCALDSQRLWWLCNCVTLHRGAGWGEHFLPPCLSSPGPAGAVGIWHLDQPLLASSPSLSPLPPLDVLSPSFVGPGVQEFLGWRGWRRKASNMEEEVPAGWCGFQNRLKSFFSHWPVRPGDLPFPGLPVEFCEIPHREGWLGCLGRGRAQFLLGFFPSYWLRAIGVQLANLLFN